RTGAQRHSASAGTLQKPFASPLNSHISPHTMTLSAPVKFDDLLSAYEWVTSSSPAENGAFVSRVTGKTHWFSSMMELDEELPEDIEDGSIYVAVPHKYDLNLGNNLPLAFTEEQLADSYETVSNFFRQRGAYRKFKDLLERKGQLEAWYEFEAKATELALREWAAAQELSIVTEDSMSNPQFKRDCANARGPLATGRPSQ
ncbi:MAG TPA: hypothetical protein VFW53_06215, partial [Gallionella sp.]|nr:hypothetical protein [Gallionella sp.]